MEYSSIFVWKSRGVFGCDSSDGFFYGENILCPCYYFFILAAGIFIPISTFIPVSTFIPISLQFILLQWGS